LKGISITETGQIMWFSRKGFGFILRDGVSKNEINSQIYVHITAINSPNVDRIRPNQKVEFEIIPGKRRGTLEAMNVRFID
jgi:cold shock CspA family protein